MGEDGLVSSHDSREDTVSVELAPARRKRGVKRGVPAIESVIELFLSQERAAEEGTGAQEDIVVGSSTESSIVSLGWDLVEDAERRLQTVGYKIAAVLAERLPKRLKGLSLNVLHDDEI